jgi:hypothetical protein
LLSFGEGWGQQSTQQGEREQYSANASTIVSASDVEARNHNVVADENLSQFKLIAITLRMRLKANLVPDECDIRMQREASGK